jgi:hypothetical protein
MGKALDTIIFWLGVPVVLLLILIFATPITVQCWFEHKLHGVDYNKCTCEKDPFGCEDLMYDDYPYSNC